VTHDGRAWCYDHGEWHRGTRDDRYRQRKAESGSTGLTTTAMEVGSEDHRNDDLPHDVRGWLWRRVEGGEHYVLWILGRCWVGVGLLLNYSFKTR
jgi:hypothetical protein